MIPCVPCARFFTQPPPPAPWWHSLWLPALICALALTAIVMLRRRSVEEVQIPPDPRAFMFRDDAF